MTPTAPGHTQSEAAPIRRKLATSADGCSCDPYNPLLGLYTQDRQYDQAWGIVHKARISKKWIAPELLDRLKKESGRSN